MRAQSRAAYREKSGSAPAQKLANGLLASGAQREVEVAGMDYPVTIEAYTLPEAAKALGRSEITFKKWVADDLVPEPVLRETQRGYRVYSAGELGVIARVLAHHEKEFSYYCVDHSDTKIRMMQMMHGYRAQFI